MEDKKYNWFNIKIVVLFLVILGTAVFAYTTYQKYHSGLKKDQDQRSGRGEMGPEGNGPGRNFNRDQFRKEMEQVLNLTPEQKEKMEKIREEMLSQRDNNQRPQNRDSNQRPQNWQGMRNSFQRMDEILTPEQKKKRDEYFNGMRAKRDERVRQALSEQDYKRYQEKRDQMRNRFSGGRRNRQNQNPNSNPGSNQNSSRPRQNN